MILTAENITKSFNKKLILNNASMKIVDGEFISLFGESGSGKSTFAKIIMGVEKPDSGTFSCEKAMMVYQQPVLSLDPKQRIGNGFNELISYHHFADGENEAKELIKDVLQRVGLKEDVLSHYPHQISGGEAQRVCIARALLFNPKLLIMDEATSMLDIDTQKEIIELCKKLIIAKGGGILFISHDVDVVKKNSDRIYVLNEKGFREFDNGKRNK